MASSFLNGLLADGFSRFAGLKITGTLPLQQNLVNEALDELVAKWSQQPQEGQKSSVPLTQMLATVKKLQIRAEHGVINVDFEIGV